MTSLPTVQPICWFFSGTPLGDAVTEVLQRHISLSEGFVKAHGMYNGNVKIPLELFYQSGFKWDVERIQSWRNFLVPTLGIKDNFLDVQVSQPDCPCVLADHHDGDCTCTCKFCKEDENCSCVGTVCVCPLLCNCRYQRCQKTEGSGSRQAAVNRKTSFVPVGEKCRTLPRLASGAVSVLSFPLPEALVTIKGARITPRKDTGEDSNVSRVLRIGFGTTFNSGIGLCSFWEHIRGNPCASFCGRLVVRMGF